MMGITSRTPHAWAPIRSKCHLGGNKPESELACTETDDCMLLNTVDACNFCLGPTPDGRGNWRSSNARRVVSVTRTK
jgi:hypothetical protein